MLRPDPFIIYLYYLNDVAKNELDISVENLLQEKFLETTIDSKDKK